MRQRRNWYCCALILAVGVALFGRTLAYDYTWYDDHQLLVVHNGYFQDASTAFRAFYQDAFAQLGPDSAGLFFRPVLIVSYVVDNAIGGVGPGIYRATGLGLHLLASCLVFALVVRRTPDARLALLLALVYCVHPVVATTVAWIPGRNDSLLAITTLLTVLSLLTFLDRRDVWLLPVVLACFAAALLTKESAVALGGVLPAIVWVERRREEGVSRRLVMLGAGGILVGLAWMALRRFVLDAFPLAPQGVGHNAPMLLVYVGKALVPSQLSVLPHPADVSYLPGLAGVGILAAALFAARHAWVGWAGIGIVWFFAFLAPTLVSSMQNTGLEHRLAVPLIGLLLLAIELRIPARMRVPAPLAWSAGVAGLLVLATMTWQRLPDYRDDLAFWQSAVRSSPHSHRSWSNLGYRQLEHGLTREAVETGRKAVAIADVADSQLLLGVALAREGRLSEAEPALLRAAELDPDRPQQWRMLATLRRLQGRRSEATQLFERARALERRE